MKMGCPKCKWKQTEHKIVDPAPSGHAQNIGGCRGVKSDYMTMRCTECGYTQDWDFAKD